MQDFRKIEAWKRAHAHVLNVRKATRSFPKRGYAHLNAQMIASAESVPFNIVEGCGATSRKEFARFLDISIKSTFELEYQLQLAKDYEVMRGREWQSLTRETVEIRMMVCGLRRTVLLADSAERAKKKHAATG